ncbi:MAG: EF-hand domain-containing protein [Pirellulaceae bacterium]|jgi:Ca2+-binding EF-hand superfamily protein|nr:EF-hand domain-containing protein [Pirellulaceae bacterium]MDP7019516.1 EF-hand domain-containing protein [Pirellulaceae bacterium]
MTPSQLTSRLAAWGLAISVAASAWGHEPPAIPDQPKLLKPAEILKLMGAKGAKGVTPANRRIYVRIFARLDADGDGRLSKKEFIENGAYLNKRARTGIFAASDSDKDDVVSSAEYFENRIITDEAKRIVGAMDADQNGRVSAQEFVDRSPVKDKPTAERIFRLLDTDKSGDLVTPEYLRVWGKWARAGGNPNPQPQQER